MRNEGINFRSLVIEGILLSLLKLHSLLMVLKKWLECSYLHLDKVFNQLGLAFLQRVLERPSSASFAAQRKNTVDH